jgi:nuclear pore complex protein Nup205
VSLMSRLEVFVDSFISNLPDVLRKLRVEEDEQRQLSQSHEHDLNLERFLIIIAYAYENRPEAAMTFWSDPDSNLAGFMHWASRRASTPLVTAFCEMLQSISENEYCATAAHEFLLDEGHHASGKMRKSLSLTWSQIFRELQFFSNKIREKPAPPPTTFRPGKPSSSIVETEPESAMMLECYLRLITKLATVSETVRQFLIKESQFQLVEVLYQLAGSQIPPRLRACTFWTLRALMTRKSQEEVHYMWAYLDSWAHGNFNYPSVTAHHKLVQQHPVAIPIERVLEEMSNGFEEPYALVLFLSQLVTPAEDAGLLNDSLPFPENLGSAHRMPGIDAYVDYVVGLILGSKSAELPDINQQRMLRLSCLEFMLTCLESFNENLIAFASETNLAIDSAMAASDLAAYVRLHPFARVMEWILNDKVIKAVIDTIHQPASEVGNASPGSPLIMGILRSIEVISKALTLQPTFLDIVRPMVRKQKGARNDLLATQQLYSSLEDGLGVHLNLVVDLGVYCGLGHPDLTLACLQLLERLSGSSRIMSEWSPSPGNRSHRNKAIVAMEADGEHDAISRSFASDLLSPLDFGNEEDSPSYLIPFFSQVYGSLQKHHLLRTFFSDSSVASTV